MIRIRFPRSAGRRRADGPRGRSTGPLPILALAGLAGLTLLGGCQDDDCINCVDLPPPVVPTGVHSISGDNEVIVQWFDISYHPYDGGPNDNVVLYRIYSRYYAEGDEDDPDREFYPIGEVAWDENYDPATGMHWFYDVDARNGLRYEYAVAAVNAAGLRSDLSYEFVTDAPLPQSPYDTAVELFDSLAGDQRQLGGFDFSAAAANVADLDAGRVDPNTVGTKADIRVLFEGTVPFVEAVSTRVLLQDAGNPLDPPWLFWFERVTEAPLGGYSSTGRLELIQDHIYVAEIYDPIANEFHYAKFGVVGIRPAVSADIVWAYQLIENLPELRVPDLPPPDTSRPQIVRF